MEWDEDEKLHNFNKQLSKYRLIRFFPPTPISVLLPISQLILGHSIQFQPLIGQKCTTNLESFIYLHIVREIWKIYKKPTWHFENPQNSWGTRLLKIREGAHFSGFCNVSHSHINSGMQYCFAPSQSNCEGAP